MFKWLECLEFDVCEVVVFIYIHDVHIYEFICCIYPVINSLVLYLKFWIIFLYNPKNLRSLRVLCYCRSLSVRRHNGIRSMTFGFLTNTSEFLTQWSLVHNKVCNWFEGYSSPNKRLEMLQWWFDRIRIVFINNINQLKGPYRANTRNIYKQNNTNNNTHS